MTQNGNKPIQLTINCQVNGLLSMNIRLDVKMAKNGPFRSIHFALFYGLKFTKNDPKQSRIDHLISQEFSNCFQKVSKLISIEI